MLEQTAQGEPVTPEQVLEIAKTLGYGHLGCPVGDGRLEDLRGCGGHEKGWTSRKVANIIARGKTPKGGFPCGPIIERVKAVQDVLNDRQG